MKIILETKEGDRKESNIDTEVQFIKYHPFDGRNREFEFFREEEGRRVYKEIDN